MDRKPGIPWRLGGIFFSLAAIMLLYFAPRPEHHTKIVLGFALTFFMVWATCTQLLIERSRNFRGLGSASKSAGKPDQQSK